VVKAGAFAVMRLIYYGYGADFARGTFAQNIVMAAAIISIVFGSARALRTPHLKRRLAFSTVSNLSYILFSFTLMTPAGLVGGLTHLVYHAFIKITLFSCAGAIIQKAGKEYVYQLEGLGKSMPLVFGVFTLSSVALMGVPPLGGFAGKWMIATAAAETGHLLAYAGIAALILSTLLTALYMMTVVVRAYFPVGKVDCDSLRWIHDPNALMTVPLVTLTAAGGLIAFLQTVGSIPV
jgi:multicomponent Na+:H+ antiporter subunit D